MSFQRTTKQSQCVDKNQPNSFQAPVPDVSLHSSPDVGHFFLEPVHPLIPTFHVHGSLTSTLTQMPPPSSGALWASLSAPSTVSENLSTLITGISRDSGLGFPSTWWLSIGYVYLSIQQISIAFPLLRPELHRNGDSAAFKIWPPCNCLGSDQSSWTTVTSGHVTFGAYRSKWHVLLSSATVTSAARAATGGHVRICGPTATRIWVDDCGSCCH